MIFLYIVLLAAGFVFLVKGSDYFVDGAAGVAGRMRIPQLIIGLTIVAMGTSAPEAAVSITAAFEGNADITIGNIVGSNIFNTFIILGIASAIVPIAVARSTILIEIPYMIFCSLLLLVLGYDGEISRIDGVVLLAAFVVYLTYLFVSAGMNKEASSDDKSASIGKQIICVVGGLAAIIAGSRAVVYGASEIAGVLGISERFIGLTIVAMGTSLPELFTSVSAARKGNADIAIGNIVGSNIFNILFIVGLTSVITDVPFMSKFLVDSVIVIASGIILLVLAFAKKKLTRMGGAALLLCYAAYFIYLCLN